MQNDKNSTNHVGNYITDFKKNSKKDKNSTYQVGNYLKDLKRKIQNDQNSTFTLAIISKMWKIFDGLTFIHV